MQLRENTFNLHITKELYTYESDNSEQTWENIQLRRNTRDLLSTQQTIYIPHLQHTTEIRQQYNRDKNDRYWQRTTNSQWSQYVPLY